ncbi:MAG: formyl transferase, partial [Actinomycetospora chiangmaiensis]|nr:formyl transferase [Actinomycetospora chiangmaiensis]
MERTIGGMDRPPVGGGRAPAWSGMPVAGPAARLVTVRLGRRTLRGWHIRLLDQLGQRPDRRIRIAWAEEAGGLPPNAELLFRLEAAIHGLPRP